MVQLVFIHGPGAGGCGAAWTHQLAHFPGSLAPTLPGNLEGRHCASVERYTEWLRGWLWAQGRHRDLVMMGYTLGSAIALQYALDYPDEVKGLILTSIEAEPRPDQSAFRARQDKRLQAASGDPAAFDAWVDFQEHHLMWVEPGLRAQLVDWHRKVGPRSQYESLEAYCRFNVRERLPELKAKLLLIRGDDDPGDAPQGEQRIHEAVPGSQLIRLKQSGHFPATERPQEVNPIIEGFIARLQ
jgi:pimeloyl-ACP methyl ester carboxylesterase